MEEKKFTTKTIIKAYIKERSRFIFLYLVIAVVFWMVTGLYGYEISLRNMSYAVIIIIFLGTCFCMWDFFHYRKKSINLWNAFCRQGERDYYLPEPVSLWEELYQEMIRAGEKEKRSLLSELDEKKKDMSDYYTMWTHQIKTPISAMRLLLQRDNGGGRCADSDNGEVKKTNSLYTEEGIERQALEELFKIEQYAEMALHYARLDSLSSDLLFKKQDIYEIFKKALKKYSVLFIGSGLSFSMEEFDCQIITDEKWLSFVVEQILSNALKYTTSGYIKIYGIDKAGQTAETAETAKTAETAGAAETAETAETAKTEKTAEKAVDTIVIEDSGIGIRESDLPRIFERGFTGYNGRMDKKSTGIGLYLCKQILDRLSHSIKVESAVGKGTKVYLSFHQEELG